jgi:hypothetical protein
VKTREMIKNLEEHLREHDVALAKCIDEGHNFKISKVIEKETHYRFGITQPQVRYTCKRCGYVKFKVANFIQRLAIKILGA